MSTLPPSFPSVAPTTLPPALSSNKHSITCTSSQHIPTLPSSPLTTHFSPLTPHHYQFPSGVSQYYHQSNDHKYHTSHHGNHMSSEPRCWEGEPVVASNYHSSGEEEEERHNHCYTCERVEGRGEKIDRKFSFLSTLFDRYVFSSTDYAGLPLQFSKYHTRNGRQRQSERGRERKRKQVAGSY